MAFRIDSDGAVSGQFSGGDPLTGLPATVVTAEWLTTQQEEIVAVVQAAGIPLNKADNGQLLRALRALFGPRNVTFGVTGAWAAPPGVTVVRARVWSGGGGGGGSFGAGSGASAGGGGGYSEGTYAVVPGTAYSVLVGVGGAGGNASNPPTVGAAGTDSAFGNFLSASPGAGGAAAGAGVLATSSGAPGTGTGGNILNIPGNQGGLAFAVPGGIVGAQGGGISLGGQNSQISTGGAATIGFVGNFPGGAGGGGYLGGAGGRGSPGLVMLDF